jgi:hypothetical protein
MIGSPLEPPVGGSLGIGLDREGVLMAKDVRYFTPYAIRTMAYPLGDGRLVS